MTSMFKPYKPKNVPKGMGGFRAQVADNQNKLMGPANTAGNVKKMMGPVKVPKHHKQFIVYKKPKG